MKSIVANFIPIILLIIILFSSCDIIDSFENTENNTSDISVTGVSEDIGATTATLYGWANIGAEYRPIIEVGIELSEYKSMKQSISYYSDHLDSDNKYYVNVTDLKPNTEYYYRSYLEYLSSGIYEYGNVKTFSTKKEQSLPHEGMVNNHRCVDLGLSVNWADTDLGEYYRWGYTTSGPYNHNFAKGYYKYCDEFFDIVRKAQDRYSYSAYGEHSGELVNEYIYKNTRNVDIIIGTSHISGTSYDAATYKWGKSWRMPTSKEIEELRTECTWTWMTKGQFEGTSSDLYGYKITGKTGGSIFIPANGYYWDSSFNGHGKIGAYWSGDVQCNDLIYEGTGWLDLLYIRYAVNTLNFNQNKTDANTLFDAWQGLPIWPVTDSKGEPIIDPHY